MDKNGKRELKVAGGIALKPSVWARVQELAERESLPRNQVIEQLITIGLSCVGDSRKAGVN